MSTYYLPVDSSMPGGYGWKDRAYYSYLRLKVDQSYNSSTNKSTLSITLQFRYSADSTWRAVSTAVSHYLKVKSNNDSEVTFDPGGKGFINNDTPETWVNLTDSNYNQISPYTYMVTHNADGTASISFTVNMLIGSVWRADGDKTTTLSLSETPTYTLSINAGTNSSITVKKGSTTLSNGATISRNDTLTITFAASTGYNIATHTVNGSTFTSGNTHTVTGNVSVVSTATLKSYTLSISAGTGSSITVKKGNTTLSNGATIYHFDTLTISFSASTGYNIATHTVNGSTFTSGNTHTVTGAVNVVSTASLKSYTLSISAGTGSSITVKKGSTTLSNGATIYHFDTLTISFSASTGYILGTHTVNGSTFTSGSTHSVTGNVTVKSTATLKSYTLSISAGTGSSITVQRTSSPLGGGSIANISNGSTIYYNDVLKIVFSASTGCTLGTHTVNGSTFTSGSTHTVTAAVTVISTATVNSYALQFTAGTYTSIAVNRTSSPLQGATQGYLSSGATIYYGDKLSISYTVSTGATLSTATLNGSTFTSGTSHTVSAAVTIVVTATLNQYTITRSVGTGASLTVERISSPYGGGSIGLLTGNSVYYGDILKLTTSSDPGYGIESMSINNTQYLDNPHEVTITASITIQIVTKVLGFVYIDSGSVIEKYKILIDSGSIYEQYRVMIDTGSEIVPY